jgi:conjugative transposon TraN protein
MKQWLALLIILLCQGYISEPAAGQTNISSYPVSICCNKTTNLVFPYPIKGVDRGSKEILAQKATGAENVLQLKAARANFTATSLSVITADGRLFSFLLSYQDNPETLNISFAGDSASHRLVISEKGVMLSAEKINAFILESDAASLLHQQSFLKKKASAEKILLTLTGIFVKDNLLWFVLELANHSLVDFKGDLLTCTVMDRQKAVRTAVQEMGLPIVYAPAFPMEIDARSKKVFAIALAPFSIARDKELILRLSEPGETRSIGLTVKPKTLQKIRLAGEDDRPR